MFLCRSSFNFNVCVFRQVAALYTSVIHHRYLRNHKRVCVELSPCPLSELSGLCTPTQLRHFSVDCKREVDDPGKELKCKDPVDASDSDTEQVIRNDVMVVQDFLNEAEEETLFNEIEPHLKRLRYEVNHWDDVSDVNILSFSLFCYIAKKYTSIEDSNNDMKYWKLY